MGRDLLLRLLMVGCLVWPGASQLWAQGPYSFERTKEELEHYRVSRWSTEHGLPQNTINALHQTRDGYLWIGTRYGIARYDGVRFTEYSQVLVRDDETVLDVLGFAEDERGRLWFHTPLGLAHLQRGKISHFELRPPFRVEQIRAHPSEGIWVVGNRGIYHLRNDRLERFCDLPLAENERVSQLISDAKSNLWVRISHSEPAGWLHVDVAGKRVSELGMIVPGAAHVDAIWPGQMDRLWLAQAGELAYWDGTQVVTCSKRPGWGTSRVRTILQDGRGMVWAACYSGETQLHSFLNGVFRGFGPAQGLRDAEDVRCMMVDREGSLWVGTGSSGLYRLQQRKLVSLISGNPSDLDEVYSVAPGKGGRVWLATAYGLVRVDGTRHTIYTGSKTFPQVDFTKVRSVLEHSSGELYLGVDFLGICRLTGEDMELVPTPALRLEGRRVVNSMCEAPDGTIWATSERGLLQFSSTESRLWTAEDQLARGQLFGLACGPDGTVWVGTRTNGLWRLHQGTFSGVSVRDGLLSQNVWPLRVEADGTLWAGTPKGLNRIRDGRVRSVTTAQGLHPPPHYALLPDDGGSYWSFGNRGIMRVRAADLHDVADGKMRALSSVTYGESDGMATAEGNGDLQPNAAVLPNGEIWFPMTRGVVIVHPRDLPENRVPPPVIIEEVSVDGSLVFKDGAYVPDPPRWKSGSLLLAPGSANGVEVKFTAASYIDSEKIRFRYRLQGTGADWVIDTGRRAFYTSLRPGTYRFQVEACNHYGYWSEAPATFGFVLPPRFYETWWFFSGLSLAVFSVLGGLHWQRLRSARRLQMLEQERAVEQERARISKDLHDDLGANLTGIALQLEVARTVTKNPGRVDEYLQNSIAGVRELVERMRDVVWSLNPACDSLESFGTYLCQYAEDTAESANQRCRIDMPQELPPRPLSAESRHHLLLAVKEALNNAAKHSGASEIRFSIEHTGNSFTLRIADNGCGFDPAARRAPNAEPKPPGSGYGLGNIESRVLALQGQLKVTSSPGMGTELTIRIPLNP